MSSPVSAWRAGTPDWVAAELDRLISKDLQIAKSTLAKAAWMPTVTVVRLDGRLNILNLAMSGQEAVLRAKSLLADGLNEIRAVCFTADGTLTDDTGKRTDAVVFRAEHRYGPGLHLHAPYRARRFRGVEFGQLRLIALERFIWPDGQPVTVSPLRPRSVIADAADGERMAVFKHVSELRMTAELELLRREAAREGTRLEIVVPEGCRIQGRLRDWATACNIALTFAAQP